MNISWLVLLTLGLTLIVHSLLIYFKLLKPLQQQNMLGWIQIILLYVTQVNLLVGFSTGAAMNTIFFAVATAVIVLLLEMEKWRTQPARITAEQLARLLIEKYAIDLQTRSEPVEALKTAINALSDTTAPDAQTAYQHLLAGETELALQFFQATLQQQNHSSALAIAHTHTAALLFLTDKATALEHYQQAVTLAPNNPIFWSRLADVAQRLNHLNLAVNAYQQTLNLAERANDNKLVTAACGHLGLIYKLRDEFELAEQMLKRALALH